MLTIGDFNSFGGFLGHPVFHLMTLTPAGRNRKNGFCRLFRNLFLLKSQVQRLRRQADKNSYLILNLFHYYGCNHPSNSMSVTCYASVVWSPVNNVQLLRQVEKAQRWTTK